MAPQSVYSTALELGLARPGHVPQPGDADRVTAYYTYTDVYNNTPDIWLKVLRNDEGNEIGRRLIPTARTVLEATNRYLGVDPTVTPQPLAVGPNGEQITVPDEVVRLGMKLWNDFAIREEFWAKFLSLKRWMMVRGDAVFHLMADDSKPDGQRLRLVEVDPSAYFPIFDSLDAERITGVYLITIITNDDGDEIAQRQLYLKTETGAVFTQLAFFEPDGWDDRAPLSAADLKPVDAPERFAASPLIEGFDLPAPITTIPAYLYRNNRRGSEPFGVSELQGIETLLAGIIQTATDQDVTMALTGIGVYVTTSGRPRNAQGQEVEFVIAPASVIELDAQDARFERVAGVSSVQPMLDHSGYLEGQAMRTTATPEVAVGRIDTSVAESGIALAIQFSPILAKNVEKELELKGKTDQLLFDIFTQWLPAYEGYNPAGLTAQITFGDPLPVNRKEVLAEIVGLVTAQLISIGFAQTLIREKLGYDIPLDMLTQTVAEQGQLLDATGARLEEEAAAGTEV